MSGSFLKPMKLVYSPSAEELKRNILHTHSGIRTYFDKIETMINEAPYDAAEEKNVIEGRPVFAYKRSVKTGLFSGRLINSYLYLSLSYAIYSEREMIVIIGAYVLNYS